MSRKLLCLINRSEVKKPELSVEEKCERTFVTFTEESTFKQIFPQVKAKAPGKAICPVTKLPARYLDPITQTPYANAFAFRCIREAYAKQLESEKKAKGSNPAPSSTGASASTSGTRKKDVSAVS
ncbi:vacuolar protein sorting-associated protein 72 homolog [Plakobranchus ocellatus]|uniref:Vacuolar protein sorting-associated protein 72 homolog n=1 Tax=Plakobranchus ocellatus TaxID=259542 RepID=A0AAV4BU13_9GAST|nr:vacuolar protein sorting-associated protein 72 homolog [Plakobranchus ocellatus]